MKNLFPREVDVSDGNLGARNPLVLHLLGLWFYIFSVFASYILSPYVKKAISSYFNVYL
jgi:hypothetical protein